MCYIDYIDTLRDFKDAKESISELKSMPSAVSLSMDKIAKFVSRDSVVVDLRYVVSFSLENERSQPATETAMISRTCSPTFRFGNTSLPNETMNFSMPRGVTSTVSLF